MADVGLQFSLIKDELHKTVEDIIKRSLEGKTYSQKEAQGWTNLVSDEVIKTLHSMQKGLNWTLVVDQMALMDSRVRLLTTLINPDYSYTYSRINALFTQGCIIIT